MLGCVGSLLVRVLDSRLNGHEFDSQPPLQANHRRFHQDTLGQLSLLPLVEREMSGDALRLGVKGRYGSFHLWIKVWVADISEISC